MNLKTDASQVSERRSASLAVVAFPVIIVVFGVLGTLFPHVASPVSPYVPTLLGVVMFLMGLTLKTNDLKILYTSPHAVLIAVILQYLIMPLTGYGIALILGLEPLLLVGLVLLGSVPGGASSNIVAYLANGNVALSVAATSISTLLSPIISPLLILWLAGNHIDVAAGSMVKQILQMVIAPILLGLIAQLLARKLITKIVPIVPWVSVAALSLVIAGIMAGSAEVVLKSGLIVIFAVILHNTVGFILGYFAARVSGLKERERRAIAVEVGMQNAGLAATLANAHYGPLASLPAAIATIWHNVGGALFAFILSRFETQKDEN